MQLQLFASSPHRRDDEDVLEVFAVPDRAEEALKAAARHRGAALSGRAMLLHELTDLLCDAALDHARRTERPVWYAGRRRATAGELQAIARTVVGDVYQGDEGAWVEAARRGGFATALLGFFDECREGNASVETFGQFIEWLGEQPSASENQRSERMVELTALLQCYDATLDARGLLDPGGVLRVALDALTDSDTPLPGMLDRRQIRFLDIYDWSPIRVDIARALARRLQSSPNHRGAVEDRVEIHLPYDFDRPSLFHYLEPILRQIESLDGESLSIRWQTPSALWLLTDPLEQLAEAVWSSAGDGALGQDSEGADIARIEALGPESLQIVAAPGPKREARAIARRVRQLMAEGTAPDDIAIAPRKLDASVEPICEALDTYGVPWHCHRGAPLLSAPPVRLAVALVRLVLDNLPREPFIEILTSRYLDSGLDGGARHSLARLVREAGIRDDMAADGGGQSAWEVRLAALVDKVRRQIIRRQERRAATGSDQPPEPFVPEAHPEVQRVAALIDHTLDTRRTILAHLPANRRTLADHAAGLRALLGALGVSFAVDKGAGGGQPPESFADDPVEHRLLRATARDRQGLRMLNILLDDLAAEAEQQPPVEPSEDGSEDDGLMSLADFAEHLTHLLGTVSIHTGGARGGAVRILPIGHLAGCRTPHVILPGLNQGQFPASYRSRPLFSDDDRLAFGRFEAARRRKYGEDAMRMSFPLQCLPYHEDAEGGAPVPARQSEEVLLFYFGLKAAARTLTLTCSTLDQAGRHAVRSVFVDEVLRRVPEAHHDAILKAEVLDPVPPIESCSAAWEVASRCQIDAVGDGIEPRKRSPSMADFGHALWDAGVPMDTIDRTMRVERLRHKLSAAAPDEVSAALEGDPLAVYCGKVGDEHGAWLDEVLAFDKTAPLSARALGHFGTCPQKFLFEHLLHLRQRTVATQDITELDRHRAVQTLLAAAYEALEASGLLPLGRSDDEARSKALETALSAMNDAMERHTDLSARAHPRLWGQVRRFCEDLVQQLIAREQSLSPQSQVALPWVFGAWEGDRPPSLATLTVQLGADMKVSLAGRVDRVMIGESLGMGSKLDLIAYGTRAAATYERRLDEDRLYETEFTLPLVMLAVAEGLVPQLQRAGRLPEPVLISSRYESLLEGRQSQPLVAEVGGTAPINGDAVFEVRKQMAHTVARMRLGDYPFTSRDCGHCGFRSVCRRGTYPERDP